MSLIDTVELMKYKMLFDTISQTNFKEIIYSNDTISFILITVLLGYTIYKVNDYIKLYKIYLNILHLTYNPSMFKIPGEKVTKNNMWSSRHVCFFSENFRAVWSDIIQKKLNVNSMIEYVDIDEYNEIENEDNKDFKKEMFLINDEEPFYIGDGIYCQISKYKSLSDDDRSKIKTEEVDIILTSYKYDVYYLKEYVEKTRDIYVKKMKNKRKGKQFLYSIKSKKEDDEAEWNEYEFSSYRNFNNLFFEGKEEYLKQITHFINNEKWYQDKGIPYTLGIGLYGPPGTGKTSFIKALSNYLKRDIISLSLANIETEEELYNIYFEERYNKKNKTRIGFRDKIIVLEDIDCMSEIVKNRNIDKENKIIENTEKENRIEVDSDDGKLFTLLKDTCTTKNIEIKKAKKQITLSFLLNLIDGINENTGRILIITSNHYDSLDPALIRPGRIDMTIGLDKATKKTIIEMYKYFYNSEFPGYYRNKIKEKEYTACEIVNMHMISKNKTEFLKMLTHKK